MSGLYLFTVYTPDATYTEIEAWDANCAKLRVWRMLNGRVDIRNMTAVKEGAV